MKRDYFVRRLPLSDRRCASGARVQVQLVDRYGRAVDFGYLSEDDEVLVVNGQEIPLAVIAAAKRQMAGVGCFVNSEGRELAPSDLLLTNPPSGPGRDDA